MNEHNKVYRSISLSFRFVLSHVVAYFTSILPPHIFNNIFQLLQRQDAPLKTWVLLVPYIYSLCLHPQFYWFLIRSSIRAEPQGIDNCRWIEKPLGLWMAFRNHREEVSRRSDNMKRYGLTVGHLLIFNFYIFVISGYAKNWQASKD